MISATYFSKAGYCSILLFLVLLSHQSLAQSEFQLKVDSIVSHGQELVNESADRVIDRMNFVLSHTDENKWISQAAQAHKYLGIGYFYKGSFDLALEHYLESLRLFEELDDPKGIAQVSNELGVFFSKQEDYESSAKYYQIAEKIASENNFLNELAISLSNQGMTNFKLGNYEVALPLMRQAQSVKRQLNDSIGMGYELKRLATYYFVKEEFDKGLAYLDSSSVIRKKIGDDQGLAINTVTIAEMYQQRKRYGKAIDHYLQTLELAKHIEYADLARYALDKLHECYASIGNFNKAYSFQNQARTLSDSLFNDRKSRTVAELQTKYETAEKEQQIASQNLEIAEQEAAIQAKQFQIAGLSGGMIVLVLFGVIFYIQYRARQNQRLQAAILLEKEKGFESIIVATEEERNRISKDLHDGIGQQLSALKLALNNVSGKVTEQQVQQDVQLIAEQFARSADEVRQISHQMMPRSLMENGLIQAIEDLLKNSFQFSDIEYDFEYVNIAGRYGERIEISMYRILQELINNIIKHANASEVNVQLMKHNEKLVLFVEDNGTGMKNADSSGHGLVNIKSRLDLVKGSVNYSPSPDSGTSATVSIPLS